MWSVGCIIGEILIGRPIFPGDSTMNQIKRILEVTGLPSEEDLESINSPYASTMIDNLDVPKKKDLREIFPNVDKDVLDLLRKTLHFNPNKRISVEEALDHEFVSKFHDPQTEPICPFPVSMPVNDDKQLDLEDYRNLLYNDIIKRDSSDLKKSISQPTTSNSTTIKKKTSKSKIKLSKEEREKLRKEKKEQKKKIKEEKERKKKELSNKKKEEKKKK